jgi:hypothetical protein
LSLLYYLGGEARGAVGGLPALWRAISGVGALAPVQRLVAERAPTVDRHEAEAYESRTLVHRLCHHGAKEGKTWRVRC